MPIQLTMFEITDLHKTFNVPTTETGSSVFIVNNWIEPATDFKFLMDFPRLMLKYRIYHFVFNSSAGRGHFYFLALSHILQYIFYLSW